MAIIRRNVTLIAGTRFITEIAMELDLSPVETAAVATDLIVATMSTLDGMGDTKLSKGIANAAIKTIKEAIE